jgi:hypothetical protein
MSFFSIKESWYGYCTSGIMSVVVSVITKIIPYGGYVKAEGDSPDRKVTILPDWRGDCDEPQVEVVRMHPWARRVSGFEE